MKNILKNRMIIGIACIVLSLFICFGLTPLYNEAVSQKVSIVRVKENISQGTCIEPSMVEVIDVGGFQLPSEVIKNKETVLGKYALVDMMKSDYILPSKISNDKPVEYGYLENYTGRERAISISIKSFAGGFSGKLKQGDIVSVYAADYGNQRETISPAELKYIEVLSTTIDTGYDSEQVQTKEGKERKQPVTVTLKGNEEQAIMLADLECNGKVHLSFVYRGDDKNKSKFLSSQAELFVKDTKENTMREDEKDE